MIVLFIVFNGFRRCMGIYMHYVYPVYKEMYGTRFAFYYMGAVEGRTVRR